MNDRTMGQRIAQCRKEQNLSQEALGDKLGVSRQAISKWESDGTVPEIDKLIALSRLFGVSVGWLLGVEEKSPPQEEELSDTQLKMVEEIVKRYQPAQKAEEEKKQRVISILLVAAVAIAALIFSLVGKWDAHAVNSEQLSGLQAGYTGIQSQLSNINARLDALEDATAERLLLSCQFRVESIDEAGDTVYITNIPTGEVVSATDIPTANISFTAVPKQRGETDTAYLAFLLDGSEFRQADCRWNGASYTAEFSLWIMDGYEICFTLCHADGTQERQLLENYDIENLEQFVAIALSSAERGSWQYAQFQDHDEITLSDYGSDCEAPKAYWDVAWASYGYVLYLNGQEAGRCELTEEVGTTYLRFFCENYTFELPTLREGDRLELRAYAVMENGASAEAAADFWQYINGTLEQQPLEEAVSQVIHFGS